MRRATRSVTSDGAFAYAISGTDTMHAEYQGRQTAESRRAHGEPGGASCHSRCQSAINGSNVRWTVAASNQRDANASAREVSGITPPATPWHVAPGAVPVSAHRLNTISGSIKPEPGINAHSISRMTAAKNVVKYATTTAAVIAHPGNGQNFLTASRLVQRRPSQPHEHCRHQADHARCINSRRMSPARVYCGARDDRGVAFRVPRARRPSTAAVAVGCGIFQPAGVDSLDPFLTGKRHHETPDGDHHEHGEQAKLHRGASLEMRRKVRGYGGWHRRR